jgi:hypothetical protein
MKVPTIIHTFERIKGRSIGKMYRRVDVSASRSDDESKE